MRNDIFHITPPSLPTFRNVEPLFNEAGEICLSAEEATPELAMQLGRSSAEIESRIAIGYSDCTMCRLLASSFAIGAASSGAQITDFGSSFFAAVSSLARTYLFNLTVFFENDAGRLCIRITDKFALPPDMETQMRIQNNMKKQNPPALGFSEIIMPKTIADSTDVFVSSTKRIGLLSGFRISVMGSSPASTSLCKILEASGCEIIPPERGTCALKVSDDGMRLYMRDEKENWHDDAHTSAICVLAFLSGKNKEIAVLPDSPGIFEQIAENLGGKVLRIGRASSAKEIYLTQDIFSSAAANALLILEHMHKEKKTLKMLISELPDFILISRELSLRGDRKRLLENIEKACADMYSESGSFLRICADGGWVNLCPTRSSSRLRITGEGMNEEIASELCNLFVEKADTLDK